jgi:DNA-binding response OmpR family regulator
MAMASVLVLEDDYLAAELVAEWLRDAGHRVVGPVNSVDTALSAMAEQAIDAAMLDINLGDFRRSFDFAFMLRAQRIPFAFLSGYSPGLMPTELRACPRVAKPLARREVVTLLGQLLDLQPVHSRP